jgi:molecular chaperone DnaK (HSP70)
MFTPRYSIGIDLGTTNCVAAYSDLQSENPEVQLLGLPQVVAPNQIESRQSLPSYLYVPTAEEVQAGSFEIAGHASYPTVNGCYAREVSAEQPDRTISAAKSWLCHSGVDRHAPILPWSSGAEVTKFSPVTASRLLLRQIVDAWDMLMPEYPMSTQLVTLTVPASFDMAARELTREAAVGAGLPRDFILIEEPIAAVYHWLERVGDRWRRRVQEGDQILVCDVGGGTTDLTLVQAEQENGQLVLRRLAVGNHLLVGGDNMDLALAHFAAEKFAAKGTRLNAWQSTALWHSCRKAKESLLMLEGSEKEKISVLGRGAKLVGGTVSIDLERDEAQQLLLDGFFPRCGFDAQPVRMPQTGFYELGLPFESDSAITHHLASFLKLNQVSSEKRLFLLLNGGVFQSPALRERLQQVVSGWLEQEIPVLGGPEDLDHAVARGGAVYGHTKTKGGIRIRGGTPRSYYVGIESAGLSVPGVPRPMQALCVVPFGMEEGSELDVPGREVGLVVGRPAKFRFFSSSTRKQDRVGDALRFWDNDDLDETSPMELTLDVSECPEEGFVPIRFLSRVTELGVLELWCKSTRTDERWKLELNVREESEA